MQRFRSTISIFTSNMSSSPSLREFSSQSERGYFMLFYNYVDDMLNKRIPHRPAHLEIATKYKDQGKLLLGGALQDPVDLGVLVFKDSTHNEVEEFVKKDPYVSNGLVTKYSIRKWAVVIDGTK